ncbi:hypothetical protein LINPERPRIM_LOCUS38330, partial [Linum perenne]
ILILFSTLTPTLPRRRPCLLETVIEAEKKASSKDLILEKKKDREVDFLRQEEEE